MPLPKDFCLSLVLHFSLPLPRTILSYFKKLAQHYNNIPEFMKVGASA